MKKMHISVVNRVRDDYGLEGKDLFLLLTSFSPPLPLLVLISMIFITHSWWGDCALRPSLLASDASPSHNLVYRIRMGM